MNEIRNRQAIAIAVLLFISGCGGGGGSGGGGDNDDTASGSHPLAGEWFGAGQRTVTGVRSATQLTFDTSGQMFGNVQFNLVGEEESRIFQYNRFSGDEMASVFLHDSGDHFAAFFNQDNPFVVLDERGEGPLPVYDAADVPGDYAGNGFELRSSDLKPILVRPSEGIIDSGALPFDFTITERADPNCVSSDEIDSFSSSFGAYFGMFSNDSGSGCVSSGSVVAYLSADKTVLLAVSCTSITQFPANCQAYLVGKS